jgi:hypothetical protein
LGLNKPKSAFRNFATRARRASTSSATTSSEGIVHRWKNRFDSSSECSARIASIHWSAMGAGNFEMPIKAIPQIGFEYSRLSARHDGKAPD